MTTPFAGKDEAKNASTSALFKHIFGTQPGQTLSEFVQEIKPLREDEKFIGECREYAVAHSS